MIDKLPTEYECNACGLCAVKCPKQCIYFIEDEFGFNKRNIDTNLCIDCNRCVSVCPIVNYDSIIKDQFAERYINTYVAWNKNVNIRKTSTSGGVFVVLATYTIQQGGYVYGAFQDKDLSIKHIEICTENELFKIQGSKYIQSDISEVYKLISDRISKNELILFSGTPCQVAAIKKHVGNYKNIILVEVLCHGVGSPKMYKEQIEKIEQKYKNKVIYNNFRSKKIGWFRSLSSYKVEGVKRNVYAFSGQNQFMKFFYQGTNLRDSCYKCSFASIPRVADITLADAWGVTNKNRYVSKKDMIRGMNIILLNNNKAIDIFNNIKSNMSYFSIDLEECKKRNKSLYKSCDFTDEISDFRKDYIKLGNKAFITRANNSIKSKIYNKININVIKVYSIIKLFLNGYK